MFAPRPPSGYSGVVFLGTYLTSIMILLDVLESLWVLVLVWVALGPFSSCGILLLTMRVAYYVYLLSLSFCDLLNFHECTIFHHHFYQYCCIFQVLSCFLCYSVYIVYYIFHNCFLLCNCIFCICFLYSLFGLKVLPWPYKFIQSINIFLVSS